MSTNGFREDELVSRKVKVGQRMANPSISCSGRQAAIGP